MDQVLELKHVCYSYHTLDGETPALSDISFAVEKGEFIAVVGTVRLRQDHAAVLDRRPAYAGKGPDPHQWKRVTESTTNVGYMLQHDELFEWRTIYHNVVLGLEIQHMMTAKTRQRAIDLLDFYGLGQFKNARPSELSGGMRQRAASDTHPGPGTGSSASG